MGIAAVGVRLGVASVGVSAVGAWLGVEVDTMSVGVLLGVGVDVRLGITGVSVEVAVGTRDVGVWLGVAVSTVGTAVDVAGIGTACITPPPPWLALPASHTPTPSATRDGIKTKPTNAQLRH